MMKKKTEDNKKAVLVVSKDKFKECLSEQIEEGRKLLEINVERIYNDPYYGYGLGRQSSNFEYNEDQKESFIKGCNKWISYISEFLKQSFDLPDSEYKTDFDGRGKAIILTSQSDIVKCYRSEVSDKIDYLESLIERTPLLPISEVMEKGTDVNSPKDESKRVFIVHGHDNALRTEIELLIRTLGYEPIVLCKQPNRGDTIIEKLEREVNDIAFSIILYTPCDKGCDVNAAELQPRARQNVVFEHGLLCGVLGRKRVVALKDENVEIPGDLSGIVYIRRDQNGAWRYQLAKEMRAAGLDIDINLIE